MVVTKTQHTMWTVRLSDCAGTKVKQSRCTVDVRALAVFLIIMLSVLCYHCCVYYEFAMGLLYGYEDMTVYGVWCMVCVAVVN